jgi:hypothetical protein
VAQVTKNKRKKLMRQAIVESHPVEGSGTAAMPVSLINTPPPLSPLARLPSRRVAAGAEDGALVEPSGLSKSATQEDAGDSKRIMVDAQVLETHARIPNKEMTAGNLLFG